MRVRLLAITPPAALAPTLDPACVDAWIEAGAARFGLAVLLREPRTPAAQILAAPRFDALRTRLAAHGLPALVSAAADDEAPAQLAARLGASPWPLAGVQLRGDPSPATCEALREALGPVAILGRSVHGVTPSGPGPGVLDYTCVAPVHAPRTRLPGEHKPALGLAGLARWGAQRRDVLALGGISPTNAAACLAAGARGWAGIRLFFGAPAQARQDVEVLCQLLAEERDHVRPPAQRD